MVGEELSFDSTAGAGRNLLLTENTFVPEVGGFIAPQAGLNERFHRPSGLFSLQRDHSLAAPPPQERSRRREKVAHRTCSAAVLCSRDAPQVSKTDVLNRCLAAWPGRMLRRQAVLSTVHEYVAPSPGPYGPFVIEYIKHILFLCSPW